MIDGELIGRLSSEGGLIGSLTAEKTLEGILSCIESLKGSLSSEGELTGSLQDVEVNPIRVERVSNPAGGITVYIGGVNG